MKLKITFKKTIKYLYVFVIILCLGGLYYVFHFGKTQVFDAIFIDEEILAAQAQKNIKDLKIKNFNKIIEALKEKNRAAEDAGKEENDKNMETAIIDAATSSSVDKSD